MSSQTPESHTGIQLLSYMLALLLNTFPLPQPINFMLPPVALLLLFYWAQKALHHTHFTAAILLGLLYDTLNQTLLGTHALLFSVFLFIFLQIRLRFRLFGPIQQALIVILLLYAYQAIYWFIFLPAPLTHLWPYWTMPLSALILWPAIRWLLDHITMPSLNQA